MSPLAVKSVNLVQNIALPLKKEAVKVSCAEKRQMPTQRLSQKEFNDFIAKQELFKQHTKDLPLFLKLLGFSENGSDIGVKGLEKIESAININPRIKELSKIEKTNEDIWIEYGNTLIKNAQSDSVENRAKTAEKLYLITDEKLASSLAHKFYSDFGTVRKALGFSLPKLQQNELILGFTKDKYEYLQEGIASNLRFVEDEELRKKLISTYKNHERSLLRGSFVDNIFASGDEKLITKYLKSEDIELKTRIAKSTHLIEDEELRKKAQEILSNGAFKVRNELEKAISYEEFSKQKIKEESFINYTKVFSENLSNIDKSKILSFFDVSPTLQNLNIIGADKSEIKNIITEFNKALNFTLKHKDGFSEEANISEETIVNYFKENANKILNSLFFAPRDVLQEKIIQKKGKPDAFLNQINALAEEKELLAPIRKLMREPYTDDKIDSSERLKLINLSYGIAKMGEKENLLNNLNEMLKNGKVDINKLNNQFMKAFQDKLKIENKFSEDDLSARLDFKFLHFLFPSLEELNPNCSKKLNELLKAGIEDNYSDYIFNPQSEVGKSNLKTKQLFAENGLDYAKWLNYDKEYHFKTETGNEFSFKIWKRNPGTDIFIGNKAQNCTAIDGENKEGAIDDLLNTFVQNVEIKTNSETVGQITLLWLKDKKNKLKLLIDSSSVSKNYINDLKNGRQELFKFLKDYTSEVAGKDVDIVCGKVNHFFPLDDLRHKNILVKIVGDCVSYSKGDPEPTYYVNSFKRNYWTNIKYPQETTFYFL